MPATNLKTADEDDVRGERQRCIDMSEMVDWMVIMFL